MKTLNDIRKMFNWLDQKIEINTKLIDLQRFNSTKDVIKLEYAQNKTVIAVKFNQSFFDVKEALFEDIVKYAYACVAYHILYKSASKQSSQWKSLCKRIGAPENILTIQEVQEILEKNKIAKSQYSITCPFCNNTVRFVKLTAGYISYQNGNIYTCKICGRKFSKNNKINKKVATIDRFTDDYFFLSNFSFSPITYEGIKYNSVEAAFQATKTLDINERKSFSKLSPSQAKAKGRQVELRSDWEEIKDNVMKELIILKFVNNPEYKRKLLATGCAELIEENTWNDTYWGVCNDIGENKVGKILMEVRNLLAL